MVGSCQDSAFHGPEQRLRCHVSRSIGFAVRSPQYPDPRKASSREKDEGDCRCYPGESGRTQWRGEGLQPTLGLERSLEFSLLPAELSLRIFPLIATTLPRYVVSCRGDITSSKATSRHRITLRSMQNSIDASARLSYTGHFFDCYANLKPIVFCLDVFEESSSSSVWTSQLKSPARNFPKIPKIFRER